MIGRGFRLGASIWGFYYNVPQEDHPDLDVAVRTILGVDPALGVEVWASKALDAPPASDEEIVRLADVCTDAAFVTVHARGVYWHWDPNDLRDEIDFAARLHAETLVLHPICLGLAEPEDRIDVPEVRRIAGYAAARGVMLAIENMRDSVWLLDRLIDEFGGDPATSNLGVCIDVGHAHFSRDAGAGRETVPNYLERYAAQLVHLHLHDNQGDRDEHLVPGNGTVDWTRVLATLDLIRFTGTAVLESHQGDIPRAEGFARGLRFLRDVVD
jgi:sugar phosphate isomerase/epimerase